MKWAKVTCQSQYWCKISMSVRCSSVFHYTFGLLSTTLKFYRSVPYSNWLHLRISKCTLSCFLTLKILQIKFGLIGVLQSKWHCSSFYYEDNTLDKIHVMLANLMKFWKAWVWWSELGLHPVVYFICLCRVFNAALTQTWVHTVSYPENRPCWGGDRCGEESQVSTVPLHSSICDKRSNLFFILCCKQHCSSGSG